MDLKTYEFLIISVLCFLDLVILESASHVLMAGQITHRLLRSVAGKLVPSMQVIVVGSIVIRELVGVHRVPGPCGVDSLHAVVRPSRSLVPAGILHEFVAVAMVEIILFFEQSVIMLIILLQGLLLVEIRLY